LPVSTAYNKPAYEAMRGDKRSTTQTVLKSDFTSFYWMFALWPLRL